MLRDNWTRAEFDTYVSTLKQRKKEGLLSSPLPAITICRQAGGRGELTAHALKQYLDAYEKDSLPWQVFEANLVDLILEKNALPVAISERFKEVPATFWQRLKRRFTGEPTDKHLFESTSSTIEELLSLGHCIIVGRGASFVAAHMPHVLKVRLTASKETAIRRIAKDDKKTRKEATLLWRQRNHARETYIKKHFHQKVQPKGLHDLVIQTDNLRVLDVVDQIAQELKARGLITPKA